MRGLLDGREYGHSDELRMVIYRPYPQMAVTSVLLFVVEGETGGRLTVSLDNQTVVARIWSRGEERLMRSAMSGESSADSS